MGEGVTILSLFFRCSLSPHPTLSQKGEGDEKIPDASSILLPLRALGYGWLDWQSREAATEKSVNRLGLITSNLLSPLRGSITLRALTQGSQSLALGLTLAAAPQLVEGSRPGSTAARDRHGPGGFCFRFDHRDSSA